jgi:hypothetical protein
MDDPGDPSGKTDESEDGGASGKTDRVRGAFWGGQIEAVMKEIAREATICHVRLLDPGMIEAVLRNDESATGSTNPRAFKKMRELLMLGFVVREKTLDRLGTLEGDELVRQIRETLQARFGDKLGGGASR